MILLQGTRNTEVLKDAYLASTTWSKQFAIFLIATRSPVRLSRAEQTVPYAPLPTACQSQQPQDEQPRTLHLGI